MAKELISKLIPIGYSALDRWYSIRAIPHFRSSFISTTGKAKIEIYNHHEQCVYQTSYSLKDMDNPLQHIEFAIKYDGINLEILSQVFNQIDKNSLTDYVKEKPTSKYRRMMWFLFEFVSEQLLDISDLTKGNYVDLLPPEKYFTAKSTKSARHRINNNLLGNRQFCPFVRKTNKILSYQEKELSQVAYKLVQSFDPIILARATHYLYTKETMSSFQIEREQPSKQRVMRFINLLKNAAKIKTLEKENLVELQNTIVDPRFMDVDYRQTQNYVGEVVNMYMQRIHYISPKPEDVNELMEGLLHCQQRMFDSNIDPVVIATLLSFGFVFIHPFEDGNGRIHRFLIHYVLSKAGFTPQNVIFPISAMMLKNMRQYDGALESYSELLMELIRNYQVSNEGQMTVSDDTLIHYQYIDFTYITEYLYRCIEETIQTDFKEELLFIQNYDRTKAAIQNVIDMPDKDIDLIIKFVMQNNGKLSKQKREKYFYKVEDHEVTEIIKLINSLMKDS